MTARRVVLVAALVAAGAALHAVESLVPVPLPVPGAKLGLANLATVVGLVLAGPGVAGAVAVLRPFAGGLVSGSLLSLGFVLALAGALASAAVMAAFWYVGGRREGPFRLTPVGLSLAGGVAHNVGQLAVASVYVGPAAALAYLAPLILAGLAAGYVVGRIAVLVCRSSLVRTMVGSALGQYAGPPKARPGEESVRCSVAWASGR